MLDLHDNISVQQAIPPQDCADDTAIASNLIDRDGYNSAEFEISFGSIGASGSTYAVAFTDGAKSDGSDQTAVDASLILGTVAAPAAAKGVTKFGYIGGQRYLKITITPSGNTGTGAGTFLSANAILGAPRKAPV